MTPATGPSFQGCYECIEGSGECDSCLETAYGCCADNVTAATGPNMIGCPGSQDNCKFLYLWFYNVYLVDKKWWYIWKDYKICQ